MLVVTLLPSWSVLSELVEPRAARAEPATALSKVNAFSVDNSQQPNKEEFNKEAYLDLSKPYT
jgi:hypothetical protein